MDEYGAEKGPEACENIVYHDAPAVGEPAFRGMHGPWLPDIEDAEEDEGNQQEGGVAPGGRVGEGAEEEHGQPLTDQLVDDDAARVLAAEQNFGPGGGQCPQHEDCDQDGDANRKREGQEEEGREKHREKGTRSTRSFGGKAGRIKAGKMQDGFVEGSHEGSKGQKYL